MLPTHSSEDKESMAPLHVGGIFTPMVIEVSKNTFVNLSVTRLMNLTGDVTSSKNAALMTKLGDWSGVKVLAVVSVLFALQFDLTRLEQAFFDVARRRDGSIPDHVCRWMGATRGGVRRLFEGMYRRMRRPRGRTGGRWR
jgi:hypothetical protein